MKHGMPCWTIVIMSWIIAAGLFLAGCEVDSASSTIEITPDSVVLGKKGESVTLTCAGGYECTWSLETESYGTLNTRRGIQVVYTSQYQPAGGADSVIQVVTVASRFSRIASADYTTTMAGATNIPSTNTTIQYATAYITQLPSTMPAPDAAAYTPASNAD